MPGLTNVLDISRWALLANTRQLDVVSHNVANVNTPGYTRQAAIQTTTNPETAREGMYGTGMTITSVIQYADPYLNKRLTDKTSDEDYYGSRLDQLRRLEAIANEAGDTGIGQEITAFFSAWEDVANNPESTAVREVLLETASNMVDRFHTLNSDLVDMRQDMNNYIAEGVDQVNDICHRIADLNQQILNTERQGKPANDLRDERQRQLDELAGFMNISWFETTDGTITVQAGVGKTLVQSTYPEADVPGPLYFREVPGYDQHQIVWQGSPPGVTPPATGLVMDYEEVTGGKLGGWLTFRDYDIPNTQNFMDDLVRNIVADVNLLHSDGAGLSLHTSVRGAYQVSDPSTLLNNADTLEFSDIIKQGSFTIWVYQDGTRQEYTIDVDPSTQSLQQLATDISTALADPAYPDNPVAFVIDNRLQITSTGGVEFAFADDTSGVLAALGVNTFFEGYSANNVEVNEYIAADGNLVAAGRILANGEHAMGDSSNALDLADLKDANTMSGGTETFNEALINWAADLGSVVMHTENNLSFAETSHNELLDLRDSVSGVNLDEEMVNMIQFQRAYQMAAKLISVADEMLNTLIQMK